ncbi:prepilin peptidase [Aggregatilinea lenta]|uniref:prepilin peptidase n=1 Tax=Aggregatilinea lenta TaxID=913108 RepID=UPI000E5B8864|nr:A24 family peptidase [Aggregatilinea lenta]
MSVLFILIGAAAGALACWATDILPRFASTPAPAPRVDRIPRSLCALAALATGLVFAYLWNRFGLTAESTAYAVLIVFLLLVALIDWRYRLILNVLIYPAIVAAIAAHALLVPEHALNILLGGVLAGSMFFLTAWLRPGELGGGDVKLATFIGVAFGFPGVLWALLLGTGSAGVLIAFWLLTRRAQLKTRIAYAPFLCLGAILAVLISPPFVA